MEKSDSLQQKAIQAAASVVGAAVGIYSGLNLLIPLLFFLLASWVAKKYFPEHKKFIAPAFSVQCAYAMWLSLGFFTAGLLKNQVAFDVAILIGGLTWLLIKPSLGPIYLLSAYQIFGLIYNTYLFYGAAIGSPAHKALLVHIILRATALCFMAKVFLTLRKKSASVPVTL